MITYRAEIDGLRAIAVISVILSHAGFKQFYGGFIGVDIFFVISGYLISSIIFQEINQEKFNILNFYERRLRRIMPALLFVVSICSLLAYLLMIPSDNIDYSKSAIASLVFVANIYFSHQGGYFDGDLNQSPLLHTWSLSVEEQFYLVFPFLCIIIFRYKKYLLTTITTIAFVSFAAGILYNTYLKDSNAPFYLIQFRAWELSVGSAIAIIKLLSLKYSEDSKRRVIRDNLLSMLGLFLVLAPVSMIKKGVAITFPVYAMPPVVGTALIIYSASQGTFVNKILSLKPLVWCGLLSYSMYLWHQPIFSFISYISISKPGQLIYSFAIALVVFLSYFSYRFIERPYRNKQIVSKKNLLTHILLAVSVIMIVNVSGVLSDGFKNIYYKSLNAEQKLFYENVLEDIKLRAEGEDTRGAKECNYSTLIINSETEELFKYCSDKYGEAIVILGDSHSGNLFRGLSNLNVDFIFRLGGGGCRLVLPAGACNQKSFNDFIVKNGSKIKLILYSQTGSQLFLDDNGKQKGLTITDDAKLHINRDAIDKILYSLSALNKIAPVVWIGPWTVPNINFLNNPNKMFAYGIQNIYFRNHILEMYSNLDSYIKTQLLSFKGEVKFVSMINNQTGNPVIPLIDNDCVYFKNGDHLNSCGERALAEYLSKVLPLTSF